MKSVKSIVSIVCILACLALVPAQARTGGLFPKDTRLVEYMADSQCQDDVIKKLIQAGADVNARNVYRETPLMFAAFYGKTEIAKLLIDKGADVNARQYSGWTPLLFAARKGHTEIARMLIEHGANAMAKLSPDEAALGADEEIRLILERHPEAFQTAFQLAIIHNHMVTAHVIHETYERREKAKQQVRKALWGIAQKIAAKK